MLGTMGSAEASSFTGAFDPSNWTFLNTHIKPSSEGEDTTDPFSNFNGYVDTSNAPFSVSITGGNNGTRHPGDTLYTTTALSSGLFSFDWSYLNQEPTAMYDFFGFILNETYTQLSNDWGGKSQRGTFSTILTAGDIFGFVVKTEDNIAGAPTVTISNLLLVDNPQSVPEPTATFGFLVLGGMGAGSILKRKKPQEKAIVKS